jgi:L-ascorbate metabolism protein UlaG (beta-lactamase superfamily)
VTPLPLSEPNTITYIGHATVLLRLNGITALTDPVYSNHIGIFRRYVGPGIAIGDLPKLDVILVSHGHWDHLNRPTLRRLDKSAVVLVPAGLEESLRELGFRDVRGLRLWQTTNVRGAEITAVPSQHWGPHCGYLIRNGRTVYFAGDTGLFDGMRAIGDSQQIDVALLPIGAYRPHVWFIPGASRAMRRVHMAPEDIPAAARMLGARLVVPIHWGTLKLTGEPIDEPMQRFRGVIARERMQEQVRVLAHGETLAF